MSRRFFSWTEARRFYAIGLPIFIAQLSQVGMNFADTAMTGQASAEDMAAVAVAGSIWAPLSLLGLGSRSWPAWPGAICGPFSGACRASCFSSTSAASWRAFRARARP